MREEDSTERAPCSVRSRGAGQGILRKGNWKSRTRKFGGGGEDGGLVSKSREIIEKPGKDSGRNGLKELEYEKRRPENSGGIEKRKQSFYLMSAGKRHHVRRLSGS